MACLAALVNGVSASAAEPPRDIDASMRQRCPAYVAWIEHQQAATRPLEPAPIERAPSDPALRDTLMRMASDDQEARTRAISGVESDAVRRLFETDALNLEQIRLIVALTGVPSITTIGRDGMSAFWLLVQHADADPVFQADMLDAFEDPAHRGDIGRDVIAMLADRVRLAAGKPQLYGTQVSIEGGKQMLRPTADPLRLNARRAAVGLPPMKDYRCALRVMYGK